jgi:hypothetical protein
VRALDGSHLRLWLTDGTVIERAPSRPVEVLAMRHQSPPMEIHIEVPDEIAAALRRTPEELTYDLRLRALAGLVERGLLSTGRAAELGG